ncbi:hypothetical protein ACQQ2N_16665 [Dokdonella sp. MW10]|uniref:hypothetical protein n=1 Tax=Dokdonella sp. MW10 TaxID=2992926 RepID=UPI003F7E58B6
MNAHLKEAPSSWPIGNDPAVSAQVRAELVESIVAKGGVSAEQVERELAARDVGAAFDARFASTGLDRFDLADMLTAQIVGLWSIVHGAALPTPEVSRAVSRQLAGSLNGRDDATDPRRRQLVGEALVYETMLALEAWDDVKASGDRAALQRMAETTQKNMLNRQAINLRKTRLSVRGMQRV